MKHEDAVAAQRMMCDMSDDPEQFRRAPFSEILTQCTNAKYGNEDGGRDFLTCPF